jgi:hypothetical protein
MHTRCPRCQLDLDAASPWVQCPRCGSPFAAAPAPTPQPHPPPTQPSAQPVFVAPTQPSAQPQFVPSTQAVDPAMLAQVMRSSGSAPAPAYQPSYAPAARPGFVADEDLAGSAVLSVVLSIVALLGGCNPVGLVGITVGLMAYAAANDRRVDLARARGRTARRFAWAAMGITAIVWVVVVLSLFYEF